MVSPHFGSSHYSRISLAIAFSVVVLLFLGCGTRPAPITYETVPIQAIGTWEVSSPPVNIEFLARGSLPIESSWLDQFGKELGARLVAPYAYRLGVVSGEFHLVLLYGPASEQIEVLEVHASGHNSLMDASHAASRQTANSLGLPKGLWASHVVLELVFKYPDWRKKS